MRRAFKETYSEISVASPVKRLIALIYDFLILVALWMAVGFIAISFNQGEPIDGAPMRVLLFVISFLFLSFFWIRSGQTLGMLAWRLRVQTMDGERLNLKQALARYIVGIISIGAAGLGFWWMFFNKQKLTWHDLASGCHVVQLPKNSKVLD